MRWTHTDSAGLASAVMAARGRALALDWLSGTSEDQARALRALMLDTVRVHASLTGAVSVVQSSETEPPEMHIALPAVSLANERARAAEVLYRTATRWSVGLPRDPGDIDTTDGETGLAWAAAAVIAVVGLGAAVAYGYVADRASDVVDRYLKRSAEERKLAAVHATTLAVIDRHVAREQEAGKTLPLDPASKAALDALGRSQDAISKSTEPPLRSAFPGGGAAGTTLSAAGMLLGIVSIVLMTLNRRNS